MTTPYDYPPGFGGYPPQRPVPRSAGVLALLIVVLLAAAGGYFVSRWWVRGTPVTESREVTPRGELYADEKVAVKIFKDNGPSVVFITTLGERYDYRTGS